LESALPEIYVDGNGTEVDTTVGCNNGTVVRIPLVSVTVLNEWADCCTVVLRNILVVTIPILGVYLKFY
jgi:hypothetical protein